MNHDIEMSFCVSREECSRGDGEADEPWIMTVRGGAGARALQAAANLPPLPAHPPPDDNKQRRTLMEDTGE